jgi:hypothetical protein
MIPGWVLLVLYAASIALAAAAGAVARSTPKPPAAGSTQPPPTRASRQPSAPTERGTPQPGPTLRAGGRPRIVHRITIEYADCTCEFIHDTATKTISTRPCPEHAFDHAEWEKRLPA